MQLQKVQDLAATVLRDRLGMEVEVAALDGWIPPRKQSAAKCLGPGGRVLRARVQGFGMAFEAVNSIADIVVDIESSPGMLAASVLHQAEAMVGFQTRMRTTATTLGIAAPLEPDAFATPERLTIDLASAVALRDAMGTDGEVLEWICEQLSLSPMKPGSRSAVRVVGLDVRVRFTLDPLVLIESGDDRRPWAEWSGKEVRVTMARDAAPAEAHSEVLRSIWDTPLRDRPVVELTPWPHPEMTAAIDRWNARAPAGKAMRLRDDRPGFQEWIAKFEERPIHVVEAFG